MTDQPAQLTVIGNYHVRHTEPSAARAAADIAGLLDLGVTLVDISQHDRHADVITLCALIPEGDETQ